MDRSLGALQCPGLLRAAGIALTTMREHYGEQSGQAVDDVDWLLEITDRGWIGFCKDAAIRKNYEERRTVVERGARLFCLMRADISAAVAAQRYLTNLEAIARVAATEDGPYIYGVYLSRLGRLLP